MDIIQFVKETFNINPLDYSERVSVLEAAFECESIHLPVKSKIVELFNEIPKRDNAQICFDFFDDDPIFIYDDLDNSKLDLVFKKSKDYDLCKVIIKITKTVENNRFTIYNYDKFSSDLTRLKIEDFLAAFSFLMKGIEYIIFEVLDRSILFSTDTMTFIGGGIAELSLNRFRQNRIKICRETSLFFNFNDMELIPDDFNIVYNFEGNRLSALFNRAATMLAAALLSSSSSIESGNIKIQIIGQRVVQFSYIISSIGHNVDIFNIYRWIYTDGCTADKAILARNIISLQCRYTDLLDIDENTFSSIQSSYNLYLKNNVNQYVDFKNKISEFISDVISKTGEYATGQLGNLKGNLVAIFGFMLTVILTNIVTSQPLKDIFTRDITSIIEVIIIGSAIYLCVCVFETIYKARKAFKSYEILKTNYKSVLSQIELNEIFECNQPIKQARESVKRGIIGYTVLWAMLLIALLVFVEYYSRYPLIGIPNIIKSIRSWF